VKKLNHRGCDIASSIDLAKHSGTHEHEGGAYFFPFLAQQVPHNFIKQIDVRVCLLSEKITENLKVGLYGGGDVAK